MVGCQEVICLKVGTFVVPSLLALMTRVPSKEKVASFTKEVWPRNSFSVLPDFSPCNLVEPHGVY